MALVDTSRRGACPRRVALVPEAVRTPIPSDEFHALGGYFDFQTSTYYFTTELIARLLDLQVETAKKAAASREELINLMREDASADF